MKIYSENLGHNKIQLKCTLFVDCRLVTDVTCDAESGINRFLFPHNSTFPHTQATGNYAPTGNQKTSWKLVNHRMMFIYNEIRYYYPEMIRVTKILHKQVGEK